MNPLNNIARQIRRLNPKNQERAKAGLVVLSVLIVGTIVLHSVFAASVSLYLSPASSTVIQNNTIAVAVRVNTGGEAVNGVQANLSYPAAQLQYISTDNTGSAFPLVAETTGGSGSIRIARATNAGTPPVTGDQLVATITFKALASSGTAAVSYASGSAVVRASDNTDVLTSTSGGSYTLSAPPATPPASPPPPPPPTSTTPTSTSSPGSTIKPNSTTKPAPTTAPSSPGTTPVSQTSQPVLGGPLSASQPINSNLPKSVLHSSAASTHKSKSNLLPALIGLALLLGLAGGGFLFLKARRSHFLANDNVASYIPPAAQPAATNGPDTARLSAAPPVSGQPVNHPPATPKNPSEDEPTVIHPS